LVRDEFLEKEAENSTRRRRLPGGGGGVLKGRRGEFRSSCSTWPCLDRVHGSEKKNQIVMCACVVRIRFSILIDI
jgi:hypothetical protein